MKKTILLLLLLVQIAYSQHKSQCSPIQFNGKSANAFSIELPQNLEYVKQIFNAKFDIEKYGNSKPSHENFQAYFQIKNLKLSSSFLDFYYLIEEIKTENNTSIKVTLLISKGYDNFISKETDLEATNNILDYLNELGTSVERKNFEVQIAKKELEIQQEKQKLLLVEDELTALESEKKEIENKIIKTNLVLTSQAKNTEELGNELQKLKNMLSDFEKNTVNKSKSTLKSLSKK